MENWRSYKFFDGWIMKKIEHTYNFNFKNKYRLNQPMSECKYTYCCDSLDNALGLCEETSFYSSETPMVRKQRPKQRRKKYVKKMKRNGERKRDYSSSDSDEDYNQNSRTKYQRVFIHQKIVYDEYVRKENKKFYPMRLKRLSQENWNVADDLNEPDGTCDEDEKKADVKENADKEKKKDGEVVVQQQQPQQHILLLPPLPPPPKQLQKMPPLPTAQQQPNQLHIPLQQQSQLQQQLPPLPPTPQQQSQIQQQLPPLPPPQQQTQINLTQLAPQQQQHLMQSQQQSPQQQQQHPPLPYTIPPLPPPPPPPPLPPPPPPPMQPAVRIVAVNNSGYLPLQQLRTVAPARATASQYNEQLPYGQVSGIAYEIPVDVTYIIGCNAMFRQF